MANFAKFGFIEPAAKATRIERHQVGRWEKGDPNFRKRFHDAQAALVEELEGNELQLARQIPVLLGRLENGDKSFSASGLHAANTANIFLLKAHKPEIYRDTYKWSPRQKAEANDLTQEEMTNLEQQLGKAAVELPE